MVILGSVLVRAPLLGPGETLAGHPLGALAVAAGAPAAAGEALLARYQRRAAFRPTPHALWAGVALGTLGARTRIELGEPAPWLTVAWARLLRLGDALRDELEVEVTPAPSLLRRGERVMWLAGDQAREAVLDDDLLALLDEAPLPYRDDLAGLVDDGLLMTDLVPPLVGPEPAAWMVRRLAKHPAGRGLGAVRRLLAEWRLPEARAALAALPGGGDEIHAVLTFPAARVEVARAGVERAAAVAPLLARLAQALSPPVAERELEAQAARALTTIADQRGAGAYPAAALALGDFGVRLDGAAEPQAPDAAALAYLAGLAVAAARAGKDEAALDPEVLATLLPPRPPAPTQELMLTPTRDDSGRGWLVALHGPAGATWGRFAHALGPPMLAALRELARAERGAERLDVAFAPDPALGDLAAHPPIRRRALTLTTGAPRPLAPAALALAADELGPRGWQEHERPVVPAALSRLRAATAPPGVYRLLAGWSLERQHAPWGCVPAALLSSPWLPRLTLDDFVVLPQSWLLDDEARRDPRAWRARTGAPRHVQVGEGDELLPVDLDGDDAIGELRAASRGQTHARAYELWPPASALPADRRLEVVACVVTPVEIQAYPVVEPAPPDARWRTFALYADAERHDSLLADAVVPALRAAGIRRWFFLRFVNGERHHLRVRVRGDAERFAAALAGADLVALETSPYFPETARYGGARSLAACERLFQAESELVAAGLPGDPVEHLVRLHDATAGALGGTAAGKRALAQAMRSAPPGAFSEEVRAYRPRLTELLRSPPADAITRHAVKIAPLARDIDPACAPSLLHMTANRVLGLDPEREALALVLWERTLEGLHRRK